MNIVTNNVPRELVTFQDMPLAARNEFDYIQDGEEFEYRFFQYKGNWYDSHEFMRVTDTDIAVKWDGIQSDSYFSGILVRYADNRAETVIVARYYC